MEYDPSILPDLLSIYYKRIFPHSLFYRWLSYGASQTYFSQREFSFTLKDDVYIRYLSFNDCQEFEKELIKACPYKIDLGAVFSHKPKDRNMIKQSAFQPLEKELVFDIDMTDYDDVRFCCSGADVCNKCWPLMAIGVQIVDRVLNEDFGFEHRLWVYSGRRGVHCWVGDEAARKLASNARAAIAEYITLVKGGEHQAKKVHLSHQTLHPSIQQAINLIGQRFKDYALHTQDILSDDERLGKVLNLLPQEIQQEVRKFIETFGEDKLNSNDRWRTIETVVEKRKQELLMLSSSRKAPKDTKEKLSECFHLLEEVQLQYCYPRLDINVTKGLNHLLKSPFCIHPKTGKVCVPFNPSDAFKFDPSAVPTISQLCNELNEAFNSDQTMKGRAGPTSLKESLGIFKKFVEGLERAQRADNEKALDF